MLIAFDNMSKCAPIQEITFGNIKCTRKELLL
jgi:hypothetical protein